MRKAVQNKCPLCGGTKKRGKTTFTADLGSGIVVIRNVPARVCSLCGADWIDDRIGLKIEGIIKEARKRHFTVEVTSLSA